MADDEEQQETQENKESEENQETTDSQESSDIQETPVEIQDAPAQPVQPVSETTPPSAPAEAEDTATNIDKAQLGKPDPSNTEFLYYSSSIREIGPKLTNEVDRHLIIPWIRKLFRPEYHSVHFRKKRNKYLLYLTLQLMNDEVCGIFRELPPDGALTDTEELANIDMTDSAEWERDSMWKDVLVGLPPVLQKMPCSIHRSAEQCEEDTENGSQLDEEFMYLLYLCRPFCVLLRSSFERSRAAAWLQALCTIRPDCCSEMKRIRNDYCQSLLGYVHELRLAGPFIGPTLMPLPPLRDIAKIIAEKLPILDPCSQTTDDFLAAQPVPEEGAFCYLAISGELLDTTLNELD